MSVAGGFLLAVIVVLLTRHATTPEQFDCLGLAHVPFIASLADARYLALHPAETEREPGVPRDEGSGDRQPSNPFVDSACVNPAISGACFVALFGVAAGLTVIYYTSQFGTLYFLQGTARIPEEEALLYMAVGAGLAAPLYFGIRGAERTGWGEKSCC